MDSKSSLLMACFLSLLLGIGCGALGMFIFGAGLFEPSAPPPPNRNTGGKDMMLKDMEMKEWMMKEMMKDKMAKDKAGKLEPAKHTAKQILANLVAKSAVLLSTPKFDLTPDQKARYLRVLDGLDTMDSLSDSEANKRMLTLMEIVNEHKPALQAVGLVWPGSPPDASKELSNPFLDPNLASALHTLQKNLKK